MFQGRRVFQIQRSKRYFSTLPFWAAGIVNYVPSLTMDVALFATVAYWLVGLSDEDNGGRFLFLILVGIFLTLAVDGWVRTIAQLNRYLFLFSLVFFLFPLLFSLISPLQRLCDISRYGPIYRWSIAVMCRFLSKSGGDSLDCSLDCLYFSFSLGL